MAVVAGMTMSLDGFVQDAEGGSGALSRDFEELMRSASMQRVVERTGAVLMGRRTFAMAPDPDGYEAVYEFQVPLFVVTHHPPHRRPRENDRLSFTFVTDGIHSAVRQARAAAGERDVTVVGGADLVRQLLGADLVDELHVDVVPVLLGSGTRLFEGTPARELERVDVEVIGPRTSLRFRVPR